MALLNGATWLFQLVGLAFVAMVGHLVVAIEIQAESLRFEGLDMSRGCQHGRNCCEHHALKLLFIVCPVKVARIN